MSYSMELEVSIYDFVNTMHARTTKLMLSLMCCPGMLLNLKPPLSPWADQMIMCFGLSVGFGLQITFYCAEVAARIYCPTQTDSWLRIVDCYRQFN